MPGRSTRHVLQEAVLRAGGTAGEGGLFTHVPQPLRAPFGSARPVEDESVRSIDVGGPSASPPDAAFMDGIQRYGVVGRFGLVPIVRGYVAAAVLCRHDGRLSAQHHRVEEFVVAPLRRLSDRAVAELGDTGVAMYDSAAGDRAHPIVDVQLAAQVVERRRKEAELGVARDYLAGDGRAWLVVDGSITGLDLGEAKTRLLGLIKSHETQFLEGSDLVTALTLKGGCRTSVFARSAEERHQVYTWYLRLWSWEERELLYGLVRLERAPANDAVAEATELSRWMLAERVPLSAPDARWDRLIYPIHQVEAYLRAHAGERS